jgi:O-methyltransferase involved in polyketide biosynthesis
VGVAWLGVTYYLELDAIQQTLGRIGRWASGTVLVLDYFVPPDEWVSCGPDVAATMRVAAEMREIDGEPWVPYFTADEMTRVLEEGGFGEVEHLAPDAMRQNYGVDPKLCVDAAVRVATATVAG